MEEQSEEFHSALEYHRHTHTRTHAHTHTHYYKTPSHCFQSSCPIFVYHWHCVLDPMTAAFTHSGPIPAVRLFYTEISMKNPLLVACTFKLNQAASVNHFLQFCNDKPPRYVLLKGESEVEDRLEEGEWPADIFTCQFCLLMYLSLSHSLSLCVCVCVCVCVYLVYVPS